MAVQQLDSINGWAVFVDGEGRFTATNGTGRDRQEIKRSTLAAVRREIAKHTQGRLEVMDFDPSTVRSMPTYVPPTKIVITGVHHDGRLRMDSGDLRHTWGLVKYDPEIVAKVAEFIERRQAVLEQLEAEYDQWKAGLTVKQLSREDIARLLEESAAAAEGQGEA